MLFSHYSIWRREIAVLDNTWWGYQDDEFVSHYRKWLDRIWETTGPDEQVRLFSNNVPLENELRGKVPGRNIRIMPKSGLFSTTIWVLGPYVVMISARTRPHYAFQLRDRLFASNLRTVFELLWGFSQP